MLYENVRNVCNTNVQLFLVGNKIDLYDWNKKEHEEIEEMAKEFQKNATTFINLIQEQLRDCKNKKETSEDNSEIIKNTISKIEEIENKVKLENSIQ